MSKILDEEAMKKLMYEEAKNDPELTPDEKPEIHDMPELKVETWAASRIHNSGWIVYSVQTVEVLFAMKIYRRKNHRITIKLQLQSADNNYLNLLHLFYTK
jgi:hypothetical protein